MPTSLANSPVRFHLSLNVSNLPRAVAFFELVFGRRAAKQRDDYAKFELDAPPLVLSLEPRPPVAGGAFNHAGFRFPDAASLVDAQRRLEAAGIRTRREEGVECCYARQTKFWVNDLDGNLWEFYVLEGDIDHRGAGQDLQSVAPAPPRPEPAPAAWTHRLGQPLALPDSIHDRSLETVQLQGSFNVPHHDDDRRRLLNDVRRTLRPGGELRVHVLTAEAPLPSPPTLPGRAAAVKHVPVRDDLLAALADAGFVDLQLTTFRGSACFEHEGIPLRETQILCRQPFDDCQAVCTVVYKGPFANATDDEGHTWQRGRAATIPLARWEALQQSALADAFVRLPAHTVTAACR